MHSDIADKETLGNLMVIAAVLYNKEVTALQIADFDTLDDVFSDAGVFDRVLVGDQYVIDYVGSASNYAKIRDDIRARVLSSEAGIANITLEEYRRSSTYAKLVKREEGVSFEVDDEDSDDVLESERLPAEPQCTVLATDSDEKALPPSSMLLVDDVIERIKKICVGWTIDDKRPQVTSGRSAERQGIIEVSGTVKGDNGQEDQSVKFQVEKNKITTPNVNAELYEKMIKVFQVLNPGKKIQIKVAPNSASAKALDEAIKGLTARGELKVKYEIVPTNKAPAVPSESVISRPRP